jgi:hypothetical protein
MSSRIKALAAGLAVALLAAGFGYWAYDAQRKKDLHNTVWATLQDVSPRMRDALTLEVSLPPAGRVGTADQLEQHAAAVDTRLNQLKTLDDRGDPGLYRAADSYLVTVREILRKQAATNRSRQSLSQNLEALRKHMQSDDRSGAWVGEAVAAKEKVDKDYRDYRSFADAFNTLLGTLTAEQSKVATHVDSALLCDIDLISAARDRTLAALKDAAAEIEKIRQLHPSR